jgi:hypothetical protein
MTALTSRTPANTYKDLLQVSNSNSGIDATLRSVSDGEGTASPLQLASDAVNIQSGFKVGGSAVTSLGTTLLTGTAAAGRAGLGLTAPTIVAVDNTGATDVSSALATLFAADGTYVFPAGTYLCGAVAVTGKNLTIDFAEGATLKAADGTDVVWSFTNCNITIGHIEGDGNSQGQNLLKLSGGTLRAGNIEVANMGRTTTATNIVTGVWLDQVTSVHIGRLVCRDFHAVGNGTLGDGVGACRGLYMSNCGWYDVGHFEMSGGDCDEDNDYFQSQLGNSGGVVRNFVARYNGHTRRCFKAQSGRHVLLSIDIRKGSDFVADSISTEAGTRNVNGIDWAANADGGSIDIVSGYADLSGFAVGICNSGGGNSQVRVHPGVTIQGPLLPVVRDNPDSGSPQNQSAIGFYTTTTAKGGGVFGARLINWGKPFVLQGEKSYARDCVLIDPVDYVAELGSSGQKADIEFSRNKVYTQTSGYLNNTRLIRVFNVLRARLYTNELVQDGNTGHASRFIDFTDANATGYTSGNVFPGATTVNPGSATVVSTLTNNAITLLASAITWDAEVNAASQVFWNTKRKQFDVNGTSYTVNNNACRDYSFRTSSGSAVAVTLPASLAVGTRFHFIQGAAGQITFQGDGTMNLRNRQGHTKSAGQYAVVHFEVVATNEIVMSGDTAA